jgi:hypothetical protein
MYSITNNPETVHRMQGGAGGLESSGGSGGVSGAASGAAGKVQETGKNISKTVGDTMGQMKEKMGMSK